MTLVSLIFNVRGLSWNTPTQHVETFCGVMSISRGEWEALVLVWVLGVHTH